MDQEIKNSFRAAITANDIKTAELIINEDVQIVNLDLRPTVKQDLHTNDFPLSIASKLGHYEICELLLNHGANPNASKTADPPPEFGIPICHAVENEDYKLADLLLAHGADTNAFPYCSRPMIESLIIQARKDGTKKEMLKYGFRNYLKQEIKPPAFENPHPSSKLLFKILKEGAAPNISAIVREEYVELITELLQNCPLETSPPTSYPMGSIFEGIVYCSSWYGYPQILKLSAEICPDLFTNEVANWSIYRGIISHNRDGSVVEYIEMLAFLLTHLERKNGLNELSTNPALNPFYLIAEHFCWPSNYGYKSAISTAQDIIRITQLFLDFGFTNFNIANQKSGLTPIEKAQERLEHPGMKEFITFLSQKI